MKSLEELGETYNFILIDSSAIIGCLDERTPLENSGKIFRTKKEIKFCNCLKDFVSNGGNLCITIDVEREISVPFEIFSEEVDLLNNKLSRKIRKRDRKRKGLITLLKGHNGVLDVNSKGSGIYAYLDNRFSNLQFRYELADTDYKLIISGARLVNLGNSVVILSNDSGMRHAWKDLVKREHMFFDRFGFFYRQKFNCFSVAYSELRNK